MGDFTFRLRFLVAKGSAITLAQPEFDLVRLDPERLVRLCSKPKEANISDAKELILTSSGWLSEEQALAAGSRCRDALLLACAKWRIGIDLGTGPPKFMMTRAGLEMFQRQVGSTLLNDIHGLMTHRTELKPSYVSGAADVVLSTPMDRFQAAFHSALRILRPFSERERLSYDLFNFSFFQLASKTRLLLLVMAFESLLEDQLRPAHVVEYVEQMIRQTREATDLLAKQKESLISSLGRLRYESIRQLGKRFASERLGSRQYNDMNPETFFDHCYNLRSRLAHGLTPTPTDQEIGAAAATLECFMSDILAYDLLDS